MSWPHAPFHWFDKSGIYMVTTGSFLKQPYLGACERKDYFQATLFSCAEEFGWQLQAWAILSNHYHFIAVSPDDPKTLSRMLGKLGMTTSKQINKEDGQPGRRVWYQFWDSRITYERSYLARLNYVNNNPVKHGVVENAENYPWCSAAWFIRNAAPAFIKTVQSFRTNQLRIKDDF
jgi:putative transposase